MSPKRDRAVAGWCGDGSSWRGEDANQFAAGRSVAGRAADALRKIHLASWWQPAAGDPKRSVGQDWRGDLESTDTGRNTQGYIAGAGICHDVHGNHLSRYIDIYICINNIHGWASRQTMWTGTGIYMIDMNTRLFPPRGWWWVVDTSQTMLREEGGHGTKAIT